MCYCNAGHDFPFLFRSNKTVERLKTGGVVLGFVPHFSYSEDRITLNPGEVLLLNSDGITEAMNQHEEEFGEQRLREVVQSHLDKTAEQIIDQILKAVSEHTRGVPQLDDMTLLVLKRL